MAVEIKKLGPYGIISVLGAILIIANIVISGLRIPPSVPNTGTLIVKLTDAPANITHLNVTIANILVQKVENENETWVNLDFIGGLSEVSLDLLELENVTRDLSVTDIPSGNYTKIRLNMGVANVTYAEGTWDQVNVPSGKIDLIVHFEVEDGGVRILLVDMWVAISESGNLRPVLKATVTVIA